MYVLLTLPTANAVSSVTSVARATSASPLVPVHVVPSRKMIVAETPGIPSRRRAASSRSCRRVSMSTTVTRGRLGGSPGASDAVGVAADGASDVGGSVEGDGGTAGDGAAATGAAPLEVTATATARPAQPVSPAVRMTARKALSTRDQRPRDGWSEARSSAGPWSAA